jgi:hypothetical protein
MGIAYTGLSFSSRGWSPLALRINEEACVPRRAVDSEVVCLATYSQFRSTEEGVIDAWCKCRAELSNVLTCSWRPL